MRIRDWYARVNAAWPKDVPPLTAGEAIRAAKRLYRFATRRTWKGPVRVTSGRRYTYIYHGELVVNPGNGWREFVHLLSHATFYRSVVAQQLRFRGQTTRPHGRPHARLELRMVKEVLRRGWLDGRLKDKAPKPKPDRRVVAYERALAAERRWQRKLKLATTMLRKARARVRRAAAALPGQVHGAGVYDSRGVA